VLGIGSLQRRRYFLATANLLAITIAAQERISGGLLSNISGRRRLPWSRETLPPNPAGPTYTGQHSVTSNRESQSAVIGSRPGARVTTLGRA